MKKLSGWFSSHWKLAATSFLLIFIPLYPKLPLLDVMHTWVYVRIEDLLVATVIAGYIFSVLKNKKTPDTPLTVPVFAYWTVGLVSLIWSLLFIGPGLANYFPQIALLHWIRRIEYMTLFFIAYDAVRSDRRLGWVITALTCAVIGIIIYGIGQKFYGFPAFLTMNEEFAKGVPLRLPPTARIASTFGGHYDLAAYMVFVIPIFGSLALSFKKIHLKLFYTVLTAGSLIMLLFTASRISFGVYLAAITSMLIIRKKPLYILPVVLVSIILMNLISVSADRFYKTFRYTDVVVDLSTGKPIGTLDKLEGGRALTSKEENPAEENLPKGSEYIGVGSNNNLTGIKTVEQFVTKDLATGAGELATISGSFLIQKALVYDISITTRFQGQWPKAMEAFRRNILLGSGYSTLSVAADGDYMRLLGETGILGAIAFLSVPAAFIIFFFRNRKVLPDDLNYAFVAGAVAGLIGLLLNAILIDVFEASKVAYTLWLVLGASMAVMVTKRSAMDAYPVMIYKLFTHPIAQIGYLVLAVFITFSAALQGYFIGDDFTWLRWAATTGINDIPDFFTRSSGFFFRPVPKTWYFLLFSVFWLKPAGYFIASLLIYSGITILLFTLMSRLGVRKYIAWGLALFYGVSAVHHENVLWISGQSSLIAGLFLLLSVHLLLTGQAKNRNSIVYGLLGLVFMLFSVLSYDGLMLAPVAVYLILVSAAPGTWFRNIWLILVVPLYWYLRSHASALTPSGDYGVKTEKFLINATANFLTYSAATFIGPYAVSSAETLRTLMRSRVGDVALIFGLGFAFAGWCIWKFRKLLAGSGPVVACFVASVILYIPYLGLGGVAERYILVPSTIFITGVGLMVEKILNHRKNQASLPVIFFLVITGLTIWNSREVMRVSDDWTFAYQVSKQTLLKLKSQFFPLTQPKVFAFVNVPIRYGRAWIFPTGLSDAMWHMFRDDQYRTMAFPSTSDAFTYAGVTDVLQFTDYNLKHIVKEVQVIPE